MPFYCTTIEGYVSSISRSFGTSEITEEEFKKLQSTISECPIAPDGYSYRLRTDLTWELVELPPIPDAPTVYTQTSLEAMTNAELEQILYGYGITASMKKANMIRLILDAQGGDPVG